MQRSLGHACQHALYAVHVTIHLQARRFQDRKPRGLVKDLLSSILFAGGGLVRCIVLTWLADHAGRKDATQMTAALCVVSAALQAGLSTLRCSL